MNEPSLTQRLRALFSHLGVKRAHVATQMPGDIAGLAVEDPDRLGGVVLCVLMFTGPLEGTRFVDVSENAMYWYFVVIAWLPIAFVIYLAPRVM